MQSHNQKASKMCSDTPRVVSGFTHHDSRGSFQELYNEFSANTPRELVGNIKQINMSISKKGTIRGMHLQHDPIQDKFIKVIKGKAIFIELDCRKFSSRFGEVYRFMLTDNANDSLWVPFGFANGFQALEDDTIVMYSCTGVYNHNTSISINPLSNGLYHYWAKEEDGYVQDYIISQQDAEAPDLIDCFGTVADTVEAAIRREVEKPFERYDI
jgi:dTDP-4-dehydrorhamnose 3,5-epimerase